MSILLILVEFLEKGHEICHFWEISQVGTGTQTGVVPIPLNRTKLVPVPRQSGTGTNMQNQSGTGTKIKWYQYQDKVVSVPTYRTWVVPIPIKVVPVLMLPEALIFVFVH